jgi:hypothetical protein
MATAAWLETAASSASSSAVKGPSPRLFRTWMTPMISLLVLRIGMHKIDRVR